MTNDKFSDSAPMPKRKKGDWNKPILSGKQLLIIIIGSMIISGIMALIEKWTHPERFIEKPAGISQPAR